MKFKEMLIVEKIKEFFTSKIPPIVKKQTFIQALEREIKIQMPNLTGVSTKIENYEIFYSADFNIHRVRYTSEFGCKSYVDILFEENIEDAMVKIRTIIPEKYWLAYQRNEILNDILNG